MFNRFLFLLLIPFLTAFSNKNVEEEKPRILVTAAPYAFVVEKIAGNTLEIQMLIPPGVNMHIYEPSPKSVEKAASAAAWFRIEESIENKIVRVIQQRNPKIKIVNLQKGLNLLSEGEELNICEGSHHCPACKDLHTWTSPKVFLQQAKLIFETLADLFPKQLKLYQKNFTALTQELEKLDRDIGRLLEPFKGTAVLVSHPALGYFCQEFGLIQLSIECEGKEPRPKDLEKVLKLAQTYRVRCVFLQEGYNNRGATLVGKKLQLPIYQIDPYARDYLSQMLQIAKYISR